MAALRMAIGIVGLFVGGTLLFLASHGMQAQTPWQAYSTILTKWRTA